MSRPTLADIAIAIMICDAIESIPGFGATWGYSHVDGSDQAFALASRTRRRSSGWADASARLRVIQNRRLVELSKEIADRSAGSPIAQYHAARVLAEAVGAVDHGVEAVRLRELARGRA